MMPQTRFQILVLCILGAISLALIMNLASNREPPGDAINAEATDTPEIPSRSASTLRTKNENVIGKIAQQPDQRIRAEAQLASLGQRIAIYRNQDGTLLQFIVNVPPNVFSSLELVGDFNFWLANDKPALVERYALHYEGDKWATRNLNYEDLFSNRTDPIKFKFRGMKPSGETVWLPDYWDQSYRGEAGNLMLKQRSSATSNPIFSFTKQP